MKVQVLEIFCSRCNRRVLALLVPGNFHANCCTCDKQVPV